jgi:preprotein translocase subunit SecA
MRLFLTDRVGTMMEKMGAEEGEALEHSMVTKAVERAQKRVEGRNFEIRKHLLEYDDVMNKQREIIYTRRNAILDGTDASEEYEEMIRGYVEEKVREHFIEDVPMDELDLRPLFGEMEVAFLTPMEEVSAEKTNIEDLTEAIYTEAMRAYAVREESFTPELTREIERQILMRTIDEKWRDHLYEVDQVKAGVGWQSLGGKDPLLVYKKEAFELFEQLHVIIRDECVKRIFRVRIQAAPGGADAVAGASGAAATEVPQGEAIKAPAQAPTGQVATQDKAIIERQERMAKMAQAAQSARTQRTISAVVGAGGAATKSDPAKPSVDKILTDLPSASEPSEITTSHGATEVTSTPDDMKKVGRNDPCPCGSGKKYKKCHGR